MCVCVESLWLWRWPRSCTIVAPLLALPAHRAWFAILPMFAGIRGPIPHRFRAPAIGAASCESREQQRANVVMLGANGPFDPDAHAEAPTSTPATTSDRHRHWGSMTMASSPPGALVACFVCCRAPMVAFESPKPCPAYFASCRASSACSSDEGSERISSDRTCIGMGAFLAGRLPETSLRFIHRCRQLWIGGAS